MAAAVAAAVVQAAPSRADVAAAAVSPADGAALTTTATVVTATYDAVAGSGSRLTVRDATDSSPVACADEVLFTTGMQALRCQVRDLTPAHTYQAVALLRDVRGSVVRRDTWSFTVDAPVPTGSWPAAGATVAGTETDPAPAPGRPATADYDRPLDPGASTAALFASSSGVRSAVPATTTVSGSTVSVEPAAQLAPGEYSLVVHAADADGGTSTRTVDLLVGTAAAFPSAPVGTTPSRATAVPESVTTMLPSGTAAGLVVYDPAHPEVSRRLDPVPSVLCQAYLAGESCSSGLLPVGDLPAGTYAWYSYARGSGGLTTSGPDHELTVPASTQAAPTDLAATAPLSPDDPPLVHVTATTGAAAVVLTASSGASTSVVLEPTAGRLDASLPAGGLYDGDVLVTARVVDALGRGPAAVTTTAPKESVPLTLYGSGTAPTIGPAASISAVLNEPVRTESVLVVRDGQGALVPGTSSQPSARALAFTPQQPLPTGSYAVEVRAYAASCTGADLGGCEQLDQLFQQPVDATAPLPAGSVVVDPRLPQPTTPSVTVSGRGTPGDLVTVSLRSDGTEAWSTRLGDPDDAGSTPFSTGPLDLSPYPRELLPGTDTSYDAVGNSTVTHAGDVDRRYPTGLSVSAGPLALPWGTTTTVSGRLTQYGGAALSGRALTLVQRRDNGTTVPVGSARTATDGTFRTVLVMTASGPVQARWAGSTNLRPVASAWTSRVAVGAKGTTPADHPDTPSGARAAAASPQGVWLTETLRSGTDVDWYAFGVATSGYHVVRLGHLPADYAVTLYDRGGNRLGTGTRPGRQFEELYRYLPAGTYYVRVSVVRGYSATVPYHLNVGRVADRVVMLSSHVDATEGLLVELLNNTASWQAAWLDVQCVGSGRVVRDEHWVGAPLLAPRARRPFQVYPLPCPSGSSLRFSPMSEATTARYPGGSWRVAAGRTVTTSQWRDYSLTLTDTGSTTLRGLTVGVLEYDAEGRVQAYAGQYQDPLAAGASRYVGGLGIWRSTPAPNLVAYLGYYP